MYHKFVLDRNKETLLLSPGWYFHVGTQHQGDEDSTDTRKNNAMRSMNLIRS